MAQNKHRSSNKFTNKDGKDGRDGKQRSGGRGGNSGRNVTRQGGGKNITVNRDGRDGRPGLQTAGNNINAPNNLTGFQNSIIQTRPGFQPPVALPNADGDYSSEMAAEVRTRVLSQVANELKDAGITSQGDINTPSSGRDGRDNIANRTMKNGRVKRNTGKAPNVSGGNVNRSASGRHGRNNVASQNWRNGKRTKFKSYR